MPLEGDINFYHPDVQEGLNALYLSAIETRETRRTLITREIYVSQSDRKTIVAVQTIKTQYFGHIILQVERSLKLLRPDLV